MINLSMAEPDNILRPRIAVMGVGGAGGNAINNMINSQLIGCDFVVANTDSQALAMSMAPHKIQLGINLSRGLGAGSKPEIGRAAAEEQLADIISCLEGADMLFITAGMGGGTGTGAAPVIARAARESGILTVGVITKPFHFEGSNRMRQAEAGIAELQQYVDTLIVIPNQNLFRIANERTTFAEAFRMADEVLHSGVRGITDLMVMPGFMNLDFADVKTVMQEMGKAMMGTGEAEGDNRAIRAAEAAISNPLLDDISMKGARGVLINITGGMDMTLFEVDQAANRIREEVDPEAQIKVGSTLGESLEGKIRVSVISTGIDAALAEQQKQRAATAAANARPAQMAAAPRVIEEPVVQAPQAQPTMTTVSASPTVATSSLNVSSSYFAMPQMITPKMVAQQQAKQKPAVATEQPKQPVAAAPTPAMSIAARQAEMLLATQAAAAPSVRPVQQASTPVSAAKVAPQAVVSPVRTMAPATKAAAATTHSMEPVSASADIRMTQLTTPNSSLSPQGSQRSQSLFQRITGFGLVRPSSATRDENDLDDDRDALAEQPRLGVDPSDRPAISAEPSDLLDIPAFLRRQTNH
ncbi:MAG: cell division protein FtsZ [Alphaproteobacteria bacterium]|nr:cell division protein FtsZ [Alphaproteobacteria bacterium]